MPTIFIVGCAKKEAVMPDPVRPVRTMIVASGDDTHSRLFPGKVEATRNADLAFQVSGVLVEFAVAEGQKVAKGEVIGRVRPDEFEARLKTLQGQLDQSRAGLRALQSGQRPEEILRLESQLRAADARLANAQIEYDRATRLLRTNAISRSNFDLTEKAWRVAQEDREAALQLLEKGGIGREEDIEAREAEVRSLEGRVVEANIQLKDTKLLAPYDGVIAKRFVEPNQNVRAKEPVVRFQDVNEIDVAVDVPETVMASVRTSDIVEITAEFSGAPGIRFPVEVREMAQAADPATQTFRVRVGMKAPSEVNLLPGMTAAVTMIYRRASILGPRLLVPVSAVLKDDEGKQAVWIISPEGTASRRPVTVGEATGDRLDIVEGLQPGERIATAGVKFLRDGMKVRDLGSELGGSQS
jgi:multidrug efflux pump subunit AcrA (membrane-fusion protein)